MWSNNCASILETNTQMDVVFSNLNLKMQLINDKYNQQFERALFNNKDKSEQSTEYYNNLMNNINYCVIHRTRLCDRLKDLFEPTDKQINKFRNNNESRVNANIQRVMTILTFVTFFWGISLAFVENGVNISAQLADHPFFFNISIFVVSIIAIFLLIAIIYLCKIKKSKKRIYTRKISKLIKLLNRCDKNINVDTIIEEIKIITRKINPQKIIDINEFIQAILILVIFDMNSKIHCITRNHIIQLTKLIKEIDEKE